MNPDIREAVTTVGETSPTGDTTRDERRYEMGAMIDGVWVPFASVGQSQVDHAKQRQEYAEAQKASSKSGTAKSGKTDSGG